MPVIQHIAKVQFDFGAVATLPAELAELGAIRPLIVTDANLVANGLLERALRHLPAGLRAACFDRTPPSPTHDAVRAALALYRAQDCDSVIAVGGGSCIDAAKGVALLVHHTEPLERYQAADPAAAPITPRMPPLIAIPTTAGTGSEVGRGAGLTLDDGTKGVFVSRHLVPKVAICDPDLTASMPAWLAAATGIDALSHCIETYLSPAFNPPADAVALDGVRRTCAFLRRAVTTPQDRDARHNMMLGALEGGMTLWKGAGCAHALAIAVEKTPVHLHHGTLVGILMPHCLRFVAGVPNDRVAALRDAMGLPPGADIADALAALNRDIGLPGDLAALGLSAEWADDIGRNAARTVYNATSARQGGAEDYAALYRAALTAFS